ncbi:MAG: hypothetical protein COU07_00665 [Candidatus Harrisonbacteria bacterium CG10_big_fil_rev_8_21_14_0_10_40_38]|uniref:Uncharacterized protein n=1 Tax=Candidatus Harrisonbacteria bacterium CG10_big_fil_rev_8_21_14_0_10_40_38 TaxID=1974583 RepID=A0A2H0USN3_9BACT|nr:MAG: hypothetical protein COU07_00665 [Candidatus Harrisonbacteria bacterium CG10_big_fil_rev_8_21_14_0_10_40_38]
MSTRYKKVFFIGFAIGFFGFFIMTLGLINRPIEIIASVFLAPTRFVLSPIRDSLANVEGIINVITFAVMTGGIYGLLGIGLSYLSQKIKK